MSNEKSVITIPTELKDTLLSISPNKDLTRIIRDAVKLYILYGKAKSNNGDLIYKDEHTEYRISLE
jgi:hypothetical protein